MFVMSQVSTAFGPTHKWEDGKERVKQKKKEAVRKNLVSVSGKVSKEMKSIQLSSDISLSLSLKIKTPKPNKEKPNKQRKPKTVPKGKKKVNKSLTKTKPKRTINNQT